MKKYISIILLAASTFVGCQKDFLDTEIQQNFDEELFFKSGFDNLKGFGMEAYNYLPQFNRFGNTMLATACDEADSPVASGLQRFNTGAWGPFNNPDDVYANYYRGIRHVNLFLEKTTDYRNQIVKDTVGPEKVTYIDNLDDFTKLRAEVRVLRAFFYLELIKRYGGVPLVTTVLNEEQAKQVTRASFDEIVNYIVSECDAAYPILTNHYVNYGIPTGETVGRGDAPNSTDVSRIGRIEKPVALALKLRALLYAASPLHNPNNDVTKWQKAVEAGMQLFSDPNSAHVRHIYNNFKDLFQSQNTANTLTPRKGANTGIILTRPFARSSNAFERANYPVGMTNAGLAVTAPSQNLVDAFEMRNGLPITDPASGYNPNNPYNNRDPRLAFTVVLNGSTIGLVGTTARTVQSFIGGVDGIGAKLGATTTGYYLRKMLVENFDPGRTDGRPKSWVLMRYEEVLLNFAEAANEAYGPDVVPPASNGFSTTLTARAAVNLIRARPGIAMPAIPAGLSKDQMRERIRNERRVELAFEEHRFFDVRRWKIADVTENADLRGMRVISDASVSGGFRYEPFVVERRSFDATNNKMYLYPIPFQEIAKSNGNLLQNMGW
ncbi:RagB/SusD family nutrient uptake outer membrane protein [Pedobacter glucosidilyticus]|uniref:RagB/SusD family nutrient uptake outer membrane protein n=1 Tax=Pedobacter glucosidilyticus TaxID=1122941 RepID=UPI0026E9F579|nr:RagB/SusD family nutrient uptake outer membrane protein [Pedobacter glucosidilyticus]